MIVMVMMPWIEVTRESETEDHQCSVTNFLYERKFAKIQSGYERIFCKNTSVIRVKIRALTVKYLIFQNSKNCFYNNASTQFLDGPFNGLSGLFKLQFLSSDSFFYQLGSENFILARNYEKVRVRNHC